MFGIGVHTLWLDLHGFAMIVLLVFSAFLFGAIYFSREASPRLVRRLRISSMVAFVVLIALMITGIVPDVAFDKGATFSYAANGPFGAFTAKVTDDQLGNFTGPLLFDMMEHVTLVVPGLAAVIGYLIWTGGSDVITQSPLRTSVLTLMGITAAWTIVLGLIGVYITKVLTFPLFR